MESQRGPGSLMRPPQWPSDKGVPRLKLWASTRLSQRGAEGRVQWSEGPDFERLKPSWANAWQCPQIPFPFGALQELKLENRQKLKLLNAPKASKQAA